MTPSYMVKANVDGIVFIILLLVVPSGTTHPAGGALSTRFRFDTERHSARIR